MIYKQLSALYRAWLKDKRPTVQARAVRLCRCRLAGIVEGTSSLPVYSSSGNPGECESSGWVPSMLNNLKSLK